MKQHELIAIEGDVKKQVKRQQTDIYHLLQKPDLFYGLEKTYVPLEEDGESLPAENKKIQRDVPELLSEFSDVTIKWLDVMASKDSGNRLACADIVINEQVLVEKVSVLTLLSLETEFNHIKSVLEAIPTLPLDAEWHKNEATGQYFTSPVETTRKKKVMKVLVHFEPTKDHPGKSESFTEDVSAGTWITKRISTAMPEPVKKGLLDRLNVLILAVKKARERANNVDAEKLQIGKKMIDFLMHG
jgi:hypothetical protein